jgi:hypothetical protein
MLAAVAACALLGTVTSAQTLSGRTATVTASAPVYLYAAGSQVPLRVLEPGTLVQVLGDEGDWVEVQFDDPQWDRRIGWVQRSLLKFNPEAPPRMVRRAPQPPAPPPVLSSFPEAEAALGWSFATSSDIPRSRLGLDGSLVANLTPWVGVVVDGSVNRSSWPLEAGVEWTEMMYTALAGPRFSLRQSRMVVPFGQVLFGYARTNLRIPGRTIGHDYFVIQPGGGVEIGDGKLAARFEASWGRLSNSLGPWHQVRFVVGVVIRSGPRGEHSRDEW